MLLEYRTVKGTAQAEITVKRSRFICAVWPAATPAAAHAHIREWSELHPRANHNVPAFRVGLQHLTEHCSDAGEPAMTAGRPALHVLQMEDLRNVAVVVTRYFGGTLLGANGLVHAYTDAVVAGLQAAGLATMRLEACLELRLPYHLLGKVQHWLAGQGARVEEPEYAADVRMRAWLPLPQAGPAQGALAELTAGQALAELVAESYRPLP